MRPERGGGGAVTPPGREATRTLRGVECRDQPDFIKAHLGLWKIGCPGQGRKSPVRLWWECRNEAPVSDQASGQGGVTRAGC